jgi:hypothetical protein
MDDNETFLRTLIKARVKKTHHAADKHLPCLPSTQQAGAKRSEKA